MALNWYQCNNCGIVIKKESTPNSSGCPSASSHYWKRLGEVGDTNYCCKYCGTVVQTKSTPNTSGCQKGSSHYWKKL